MERQGFRVVSSIEDQRATQHERAAMLERASVRRVVDFLDDEADRAPTPECCALWRRLAANTRREMIRPG